MRPREHIDRRGAVRQKQRPWSSSDASARRGPQFAAQARTRGNAASLTSFCALCPPTAQQARREHRHAIGDCGWSQRNATCFCLGSVINRSATALHNLASGAPGATVLMLAASPVEQLARASPANTCA